MNLIGNKITFALFFGNRGFFPGEVIESARKELKKAVSDAGFDYIFLDEKETRYGAVETIKEGKKYAEFLEKNRGKFDGVIICLPNFGDENGVMAALKDAGVPILVQAYPDEIGKMDFAQRRDAMCGKFGVCNLLRQANIPYTLTEKFVVHPLSDDFKRDLEKFAGICRIVKGMKSFNVGAIGARTTAFKTVRVDEIAFQRKGINIETVDLSDVFDRMNKVSEERIAENKNRILDIAEFSGYPEEKLTLLAKAQAAFEDVVNDFELDAVAIRCWNEFETVLGIAPCICLSLLNEMGISAACEVDITNAVMMRALSLASDSQSMLLDYNNNYGDDPNKAIMFHCGPIAPSLTIGKGKIVEHLMFKKSFGDGSGVGVNKNHIKPGNITFGSIKTENGKIWGFVAEAKSTEDVIEEAFFGSGTVVEKENLGDIANYMAENGYKHHLAITYGDCASIINEAFGKYLDFEIEAL